MRHSSHQHGIAALPIILILVGTLLAGAIVALLFAQEEGGNTTRNEAVNSLPRDSSTIANESVANMNSSSAETNTAPGSSKIAQNLNVATEPTAGWNSYRSERFGFSLKYPGEWEVSEESVTYGGGTGDQIRFSTPIAPDNPSQSNVSPKVTIEVFPRNDNELAEAAYLRIVRIDLSDLPRESVMIGGVQGSYYRGVPGHVQADVSTFVRGESLFTIARNHVDEETYQLLLSSVSFFR